MRWSFMCIKKKSGPHHWSNSQVTLGDFHVWCVVTETYTRDFTWSIMFLVALSPLAGKHRLL